MSFLGLFDSEYKYYAFGTTESIIEKEDYIDTMLSSVYSATKQPDEEIVPNLIASYVAGVPGMAHRYYKFAQNGKYYWGLPEGGFSYRKISDSTILQALQNKTGLNDVALEKVHYDLNGAYQAALDYLLNSAWYDLNNTAISVWPTVKAIDYIETIEPGEPGNEDGEEPLEIIHYYYYDSTISALDFSVIAEKVNGEFTGAIRIVFRRNWEGEPNPGIDYFNGYHSSGDYVWHNIFFIIELDNAFSPETGIFNSGTAYDPSVGIWVVYDRASEGYSTNYQTTLTNAEITEVGESTSQRTTFYPISVIYSDNISYEANSVWENSLRKLLNILNIKLDTIREEFDKAVAESNANDLYLLDFYIFFGAQITPDYIGGSLVIDSESPLKVYIFEFYKLLYQNNTLNRSDYAAWESEYAAYLWDRESIPTSDDDDRSFDYDHLNVAPKVPQQSFVVKEAGDNGFKFRFSWSYIERYESSISTTDALSNFNPPTLSTGDNHFYYSIEGEEIQENGDTLYVVFVIVNGESSYLINTPDGEKVVQGADVKCPISYEVIKKMPFRDAEYVLQEGLSTAVLTVIEEEIQWYQQSFWKGIFVIITFAIVIVSFQIQIAGLVAALGITGIAATTVSFTVKFALSMIASVSASLAFEDPIITFVVSLAMGVALSGGTLQTFLDGIWKDFQTLPSSPLKALSHVSNLGGSYTKLRADLDLQDYSIDEELAEDQLNSREQEELNQERLTNINMLPSLRRVDDTDVRLTPEGFIATALETDPAKGFTDVNKLYIRPRTDIDYTYGMVPVSEYI